MSRTLYGYMLRELLKLLVASTLVLVIVLSFGAAIKPISEGLLGPWQLVKVIGYLMPGMLTFALPFAAVFSGTMVLFRMSADNEITAWAASGVSYRELLMPVMLLGVALTLCVFLLSNWVVPTFWRLVSREIEQDAATLVINKLQQRELVDMGRMILYADAAEQQTPTESRAPGVPMPDDRLVLRGVAVGKLDDAGLLRAQYTAELAVVDLYHDALQQRVFASMQLSNVTVNDPDAGAFISVNRQTVKPVELPSPFQQKPKFLSLRGLREMAADPQRSADVRRLKEQLCQQLDQHAQLSSMLQRLNGGSGDGDGSTAAPDRVLTLSGPRGETYLIEAPRAAMIEPTVLGLNSDGENRVTVRVRSGGLIRRRLVAESARLEVEPDVLGEQPTINLTLDHVSVITPDSPTAAPTELRQMQRPLLTSASSRIAELREAPIVDLLKTADAYETREVRLAAYKLSYVVNSLFREIAARLHERAAIAVICVLALTLGAVMAMTLRFQLPLVIFFWCFAPVVVGFLIISGGQNLMRSMDSAPVLGAAMMWSGNAALALLIGGVYWRLSRN